MADLEFLSEYLNGLLQQLNPQQKQKLAMDIAKKIRQSQKRRITQQLNSDGSSYKQRKRPVKALKPVSFIYQKSNGQKRLVELKSYRRTPTRLIGYDSTAKGVRTFVKTRIVRYLPNNQSTESDRSQNTRNKMFKQVRNAQYLRVNKTGQGAEIGFNARLSSILNIHQFGLMGEVEKGKQVKYAKRELLGFSQEEKLMIEHELLSYFKG